MSLNPYIIGAAAAGIVLLRALWRLTRCVHAWDLADKTELPSRIEELIKSGWRPGLLYHDQISKMSRRTLSLTLRCPKCGAAKIHRETSVHPEVDPRLEKGDGLRTEDRGDAHLRGRHLAPDLQESAKDRKAGRHTTAETFCLTFTVNAVYSLTDGQWE